MTYTLAMKACLSPHPRDRPSFPQILTILEDLKAEVATGTYLNSGGASAVRSTHFQCHLHANVLLVCIP